MPVGSMGRLFAAAILLDPDEREHPHSRSDRDQPEDVLVLRCGSGKCVAGLCEGNCMVSGLGGSSPIDPYGAAAEPKPSRFRTTVRLTPPTH